jgi:hypothetical protein
MGKKSVSQQLQSLAYTTQRKIIGILGIAFPFILALGAWIIFETGLQNSISSYYHTDMQPVFVGILFVIGFFLFTYQGYDIVDNIAAHIGGISAIGGALFPASSKHAAASAITGHLHLIFSALFFFTLIYFSLCLFTKTAPDKQPTRKKRHRNKIYRTCGYVMFACLALIALNSILPKEIRSQLKAFHPGFWLESIAVIAFGISWLVKGEAILRDKD